MATTGDISALYQEFTEALTEVLAELSVGPARRGRLARARAALKKHPKYSEHDGPTWQVSASAGVAATAATGPNTLRRDTCVISGCLFSMGIVLSLMISLPPILAMPAGAETGRADFVHRSLGFPRPKTRPRAPCR